MLDAGSVGALFSIKDEASPVIRNIIAELEAMQSAVDKAKLALAELKMPPGLTRSVGNAAKAMKSLGNEAARAGNEMTAGLGRADASFIATTEKAGILKKELAAAAREAREIRVGGVGGRAGMFGHGGGGSGGGSHGGDSSHGMFHARWHGSEPSIGARSSDAGLVVGAVDALAAANLFEKGAEVKGAEERLRLGGIPQAEIDKARRESARVGAIYGFSVDQMLDMVDEIRNPLGGVDHALEHLPTLAKAMTVIRGMDTKRGGDGKVADDAYDLVKSAEFRNAVKPEEFDAGINSMVKSIEGTGGRVTPRDWLAFSKYARQALPGLNSDFLYTMIPEMIQEFGGAAEGTSLASLYQQIVAGQIRTTGMKLFDQLGYIDPSKVEYDKAGRIVRLMPGANVKAGEFQQDPALFAANLVQEMAKKISDDPNVQRQWVSQMVGNRNAAQQLAQFMTQMPRINRGADAIRASDDIDAASKELIDNNPWTAWDRLKNNFKSAVGLTGDNAMGSMTGFFNGLANVVGWYNKLVTTPAGQSLLPDWIAKPGGVAPGAQAPSGLATKVLPAHSDNTDAAAKGSKDFDPKSLPAPKVNVDVKPPGVDVKVNVMLDGASIAAAVSKTISVTAGRVTNASSGFDGRANEVWPDHGLH